MELCRFYGLREDGVPAKVLLDNLQDVREAKVDSWFVQPSFRPGAIDVEVVLESQLNTIPDFCAEGHFNVIENAVFLLREAEVYTAHHTIKLPIP